MQENTEAPGNARRRLISAHEIACFAYCPEQWRLQYGLKLPPGNRAELAAGTRHHRRKTVAVRKAGLLTTLGTFLGLIAASAFFVYLLLVVWR
ncbi:hypothetical protein [Planctomyces sp. SH-PL62]|uniref:hypothetical protein n=1 Tax=Planctomyces sp. SH-PL62 TaxID=1636152 RepID=UPI00078C4261|nr:hypothetical protein [Planctomyces sp. SH-PL62]AMV40234.1 hypothetical protein VT85_22575 [Planctomyces sp. SH-PL62]